jgi:hypothetical protein
VGDTLFASGDKDVVIRIESNSTVLVKSGSIVAFAGQGGSVDVVLDDGQIFLSRGRPHELASVRVVAEGFSFTPRGTAAAVKTGQGAPTVAVLRGSVRMQSEQGETVAVGPGQFGTVGGDGRLVSGELNERGVRQLQTWTGVNVESTPMQLAQAGPVDELFHETPEEGDGTGVPPPQNVAPAPAAPVTETPPAAVPATAQADDDSDADTGESAAPPQQQTVSANEARERDDRNRSQPTSLFSRPDFELSAGMTTVNGEPWTRFALGIDIPIWRFGVFLDLELFFDTQGRASNRGWDFSNDPADAIFRKIRYIRYGRETDPLFVKFGGLSSVSLGYGIVMGGFTNMLRYPEEKLLGLQFNLNDISPLGVTMQTLISDFAELSDGGGVIAGRLAFRPLKTTGLPLLNKFSVGATYALDRNTLAPAGGWEHSAGELLLQDISNELWFPEYKNFYENRHPGQNLDSLLARLEREQELADSTSSFSVYGFDVGMPIINSKLLNVTLYGQYAARTDTVRGWGIGAPGVAFNLWRLTGNVEYRKVEGRFTPNFFDRFYLDERYSRQHLLSKGERLPDISLNGIFGRLGMDVFGLLNVDGWYQYMVGDDHRFRSYEATAGLGGLILDRVPKFNTLEVYARNSNVGLPGNVKFDKDGQFDESGELAWLFDRTPYMYWGYRAGFDIAAGASLIWDYRYGWRVSDGRLVSDNRMFLQAALRF